MSLKDYLYFYRVLNWKHKVSSLRPMGYVFFGYFVAGNFAALPLAANTLALLGAHFFWYAINDYSDLTAPGEENYMKKLLMGGKITRKQALALSLLPLLLAPLIFLTGSSVAITIFAFSLFWNYSYSAGPLHFKSRKYLWLTEALIPAPLTFIESTSVLSALSVPVFFMAVVLALFYFYTGILHILEDAQAGEKIRKVSQRAALKLLRILPLASAAVSLVFAWFYPVFLITTLFSLIRFFSLKKFRQQEVEKTRRNLFSSQLSLYEFAIYALFGVMGVF